MLGHAIHTRIKLEVHVVINFPISKNVDICRHYTNIGLPSDPLDIDTQYDKAFYLAYYLSFDIKLDMLDFQPMTRRSTSH